MDILNPISGQDSGNSANLPVHGSYQNSGKSKTLFKNFLLHVLKLKIHSENFW